MQTSTSSKAVHPVDSALGLRVVRYTTPPVAVDLIGHAFDTVGGFVDVRLTEMEYETQSHHVHGNPD